MSDVSGLFKKAKKSKKTKKSTKLTTLNLEDTEINEKDVTNPIIPPVVEDTEWKTDTNSTQMGIVLPEQLAVEHDTILYKFLFYRDNVKEENAESRNAKIALLSTIKKNAVANSNTTPKENIEKPTAPITFSELRELKKKVQNEPQFPELAQQKYFFV